MLSQLNKNIFTFLQKDLSKYPGNDGATALEGRNTGDWYRWATKDAIASGIKKRFFH
jgi:hypothetical protein